tara:strand:- start:26 stop:133 length:108 start_codon:yes stop_codon:yes gene_type:complete
MYEILGPKKRLHLPQANEWIRVGSRVRPVVLPRKY